MSSLKGKTVLITGGTGSFGRSVTTKLLSENEVSRIIIFSRDENKQHEMRIDFENPLLHFEIGDVRDEKRLSRVMQGVDLVFHAAALKHVPACEYHPMEAVKTNIIGTDNVINAAIHHNVEKVVVLSTDKAAYPVNAMGCSKMMMEKVMVSRAESQAPGAKTVLCGVRYGNVLFSRGSVLPLFFNQIKLGKPLTVTHPDMTRFLMPLSDAIELVLYSLRHGSSGDLFIHKAKAAAIGDLAKACLAVAGIDSSVKVIGVRAGEKMDETLATAEELARAEDLQNYWRIRSAVVKEADRFIIEGNKNVADLEAFTSANTQRLTINEIEKMILALPEYKDFSNQ